VPEADNPYRNNEFFVGRRAELDKIHKHVAVGQSSLLIGGRRTGKSFLISRIENVGRRLIKLDAGAWQLDSETVVLDKIGRAIDEHMGDKPPPPEVLYSRTTFEARLKSAVPLAIFIDEADRMLNQPWAGTFLSYLRWVDGTFLGPQIAFLLVGGPTLAEYRNMKDGGSPPLNTADPIFLEPLATAEVAEMITKLPKGTETKDVVRVAGGHPWLVNKLLAACWDGEEFAAARAFVLDQALENFKVWQHQLGTAGAELLKKFPSRGLEVSVFLDGKMLRYREALLKCRYTCLVRREGTMYHPGPELFLKWLSKGEPLRSWDVAISYASENEDIARAIHRELKNDLDIFFAPEDDAWTWGKDLNEALPNVYGVESRFVLVLSSTEYVRKHWTMKEFAAALKSLGTNRLLIVNLGKLPPKMPSGLVYIDASPAKMVGLATRIRSKINELSTGQSKRR
jgi:hypothetical protein